MNAPQVLVYERDGQLARMLRPLARQRRWLLREPRRSESCFALLKRGGPAVVVLALGRDLVEEFTLLRTLATDFPDARPIVVSDTENPSLVCLAWDLGAAFVIAPPQPRQLLPGVVAGLLSSPAPPTRATS